MIPGSFKKCLSRCGDFLRSEDGPSVTEYAVMLALIVLVSMAVIHSIGDKVYFVYEDINTAVGAVGS